MSSPIFEIGLDWTNCNEHIAELEYILNVVRPSINCLNSHRNVINPSWIVNTPDVPIKQQKIFQVFDRMKTCGFGMEIRTIRKCFRAWVNSVDINIYDDYLTITQRCAGDSKSNTVYFNEIIYIIVSRVSTWEIKDDVLAEVG